MVSLLFVPLIRAQDNPLNDPDLKEMLKKAQEMQKQADDQTAPSPATKTSRRKNAKRKNCRPR
ncbi:MAG: hypothetical protein DME65_07715 [Verrucomicrobia bacterium]|nr:MAG: hypothetical protein DME65_07715 [Verrucomicrobiota bacterium]